MKFSAKWQDDAQNASPEERATVADTRIWLNDKNVTQHLCGGELRDHVTVALYGLAEGIAHDWWTIFGSRNGETRLLKYRNGFVIPDLRVKFDGAVFEISAWQRSYRDPDIRFWGGYDEVMPRAAGEAVLSDIVEQVLARLEGASLGQTGLASRWQRVQESRNSAEAAFCEGAGALGLDPYRIDEEDAAFIEGAERHFETEALTEFVSGSAGVEKSPLLDWVEQNLREDGERYRVPDLASAAEDAEHAAPAKRGEKAWALGYRRARALRHSLGLSNSRRFPSFQDLAGDLGADRHFELAPRVNGIKALRARKDGEMRIYLRDHGTSNEANASHLFAMARAIGDAACFPDTALAPVNDLRNAFRQAANRAFAAEFLAPIDEIRSMLDDKRDLVTIADEFAVDTMVIEKQIENEERIADACA